MPGSHFRHSHVVCGDTPPDRIIMLRGDSEMVFNTDGSGTDRGWRVSYEVTRRDIQIDVSFSSCISIH